MNLILGMIRWYKSFIESGCSFNSNWLKIWQFWVGFPCKVYLLGWVRVHVVYMSCILSTFVWKPILNSKKRLWLCSSFSICCQNARLHHSTDQLRPQPIPHGFLIIQRLVGCPKKIVSEHFTGALQYPNSVSFKSHIQYPNTYMPWAPENMKNRGFGHLKNQGMYHKSL